jgi:hypothetical protein
MGQAIVFHLLVIPSESFLTFVIPSEASDPGVCQWRGKASPALKVVVTKVIYRGHPGVDKIV